MATDKDGGKRLANRVWYGNHPLSLALLPLSWMFSLIVRVRAGAYRMGWLESTHVGVPVMIVGNLTVGGTGKTPLVLWLVARLRQLGFFPGVVSRGYGRRDDRKILLVAPDSDPREAGDEPVLIARNQHCPVVVGADRVAAARRLRDEGVDVIVADDGLQHYRLRRDAEIVVIDGVRGLGNGRMLPAGPLREPARRLENVDSVIVNGGRNGQMDFCLGDAQSLQEEVCRPLRSFAGKPVHAVAGTGAPERFFSALRAAGLEVMEHPFPDHHAFRASDLNFQDSAPVLMTEKDAVKCRGFVREGLWQVPGHARLSEIATSELEKLLQTLHH